MSFNIGTTVFSTEKAKERFIKKYTQIICRHGYETSDIENEVKILTDKFGKDASFNDAIWSMFNKKILEIGITSPIDLEKLSNLHFDMSLFLNESGEDDSQILQEAHRYKLLSIKDFCKKVSISSISTCESCKNLNGKVYDINTVIKEKILPNKNCTALHFKTSRYPFCSCLFRAEM